MKVLTGFLACVLLASSGTAQALDTVRWKSKHHPFDELPEELPKAARSAIDFWVPWARENG